MRLKRHLNEATRPPVGQVKRFIATNKNKIERIIKSGKDFEDVILRLNVEFMNQEFILFYSDYTPSKEGAYIIKGAIDARFAFIGLFLSPRIMEDFDSKKFFSELLVTLTHETLHKKQFRKMPRGVRIKQQAKATKPGQGDIEGYLSTDIEIEAYANEIATELKAGVSSKLIAILSNIWHLKKIKDKYLKKIAFYLGKDKKALNFMKKELKKFAIELSKA